MTTPNHVRDHVYGIVAHPTMSAEQKAEMLKRVSDATTAIQRPVAYAATDVPALYNGPTEKAMHSSTLKSDVVDTFGKPPVAKKAAPAQPSLVEALLRAGRMQGVAPTTTYPDVAPPPAFPGAAPAPTAAFSTAPAPPPLAAGTPLAGPAATASFAPAPDTTAGDEIDRQQALALAALTQPTAYPTPKAPGL